MKAKLITFIIALIAMASCTNDKPIFDVKVLDSEGSKVQFVPNMPLQIIQDSTLYYYTNSDILKAINGAEISKGVSIYKSGKFEIRVIVIEYFERNRSFYDIIIRTFSNDFKIIDSYIMASTTNNLNCDGIINENLEITTTCADGSTTVTLASKSSR